MGEVEPLMLANEVEKKKERKKLYHKGHEGGTKAHKEKRRVEGEGSNTPESFRDQSCSLEGAEQRVKGRQPSMGFRP